VTERNNNTWPSLHVGADRATWSRIVHVLRRFSSAKRVVEIWLVPYHRRLRAGAVNHVSGHWQRVSWSGNIGDSGGRAGPRGPPVNDGTRRFMFIHSFLETQRTARSALTTIHHFSRSLPQFSITADPPVACAGPGRRVALLGTRRPLT